MKRFITKYGRKIRDLSYITLRNLFVPIHVIIAVVVALLVSFGNTQEGLFLGIILVVNTVIGLVQEIRAWSVLEHLQLLTALHATRKTASGGTESVLAEDLVAGDEIMIKTGDQVPCDGTVVATTSIEISEALITGESDSFVKSEGNTVPGGSIVTSGSGTIRVDKPFSESTLAIMTKSIRRYSRRSSPIQESVNMFITYAGITLALSTAFIIVRGVFVHDATAAIVSQVGSLTSVLMPQGLLIATTIVFSYGATRLLKDHVLLQEINATEKLGRIKNLCMDKTGTITENLPVVESINSPSGISEEDAKCLTALYIKGSGDSSQTIKAIDRYVGSAPVDGVAEALSFSSKREYGAIHVKRPSGDQIILAGAPDIFLDHISNPTERTMVQNLLDENAHLGKRVFAVLSSKSSELPESLSSMSLSVVAVYVLTNSLRPGIKEAIDFFQKRGVTIRIISGDNPETVQAIAALAGVAHTDSVITGTELESWSKEDFATKARQYSIFARIKPEQKEKIIEALKLHGFTAMVGDGANDALAIKKADLGISVYEGAPATRSLASVVLMENNFSDMPVAVQSADMMIQKVELFSSIFFNQIFVGFFFFVIVSAFGLAYPLSPLTIAFATYFYVVLPGFLIFYWILYGRKKDTVPKEQPFLKRVLPFAAVSAVFQSLVIGGVFLLAKHYLSALDPSTFCFVSFVVSGSAFFLVAAGTYDRPLDRSQKIGLLVLFIVELVGGVIVFQIPAFIGFFNLQQLPLTLFLETVPGLIALGCIQYFFGRIIRRWFA